jgi:predicted O-methyltransferase YrrM
MADWLASPQGRKARERASELVRSSEPLAAATTLRAEGLTAEQASAALEQATLQRVAAERGMDPGPQALLTRDGLEAATRPVVARHRAEILRTSGARRVLDLTGGLGFDTGAFLAAGLEVTALERDPVIAALLKHNHPTANVIVDDATTSGLLPRLLAELDPTDVVFVDPARRDPSAARDARTARARPERDPERWSPPMSWVASIEHARIAVKVTPGFRPTPGWQAQWVSVDRTVVECALYSWSASEHDRIAVIAQGDDVVATVPGSTAVPAIAEGLGAWLIEVDPAIISAGATDTLARCADARALDDGTTWLTGDRPIDHPGARGHRVLLELQGSSRDRRRQLAALGITRATVKSRDARRQPFEILRDLGIAEGPGHVIIETRLHDRTITVVADQRDS